MIRFSVVAVEVWRIGLSLTVNVQNSLIVKIAFVELQVDFQSLNLNLALICFGSFLTFGSSEHVRPVLTVHLQLNASSS